MVSEAHPIDVLALHPLACIWHRRLINHRLRGEPDARGGWLAVLCVWVPIGFAAVDGLLPSALGPFSLYCFVRCGWLMCRRCEWRWRRKALGETAQEGAGDIIRARFQGNKT